ncbi:unnamed protein product [Linum trigynum]|uniref:Uncharacterized protein n=1 Tax=Linum trigynum TaxID=586398 RepID=A0AAV2CPZ7_9ROSI
MGKMKRAPATVAPQKKRKKQSYPEQVATVSIHLAELCSSFRAAELKLEAFKGGLPPLPLSAVAGTMVDPLATILEMQRGTKDGL